MRRHRETPESSRRQTESISSSNNSAVSGGEEPAREEAKDGLGNVYPLFRDVDVDQLASEFEGEVGPANGSVPPDAATAQREEPEHTSPQPLVNGQALPSPHTNTLQDQQVPAWVDHPITKALEALHSPENGLNPMQIIADSLLPQPVARVPSTPPPHIEQRIPEEVPIRHVPPAPPAPPVPREPEITPVEEAPTHAVSQEEFWGVWLGHQEQLRRQCVRLMAGNMADAEDALSSAMLRASQKFLSYAGNITNEKAWLSKLVHNVCIDHYRHKKRTCYQAFEPEVVEQVDDAMFTGPQPSPEEVAVSREQVAELDRCMDQLSNNLRVPLVLRCVEGWSYPDIAEELDVRADTVRKRVQLARDFLRQRDIR